MFLDRIIGALTFRPGIYKEVEKDTSFTTTAWLLVAASCVAPASSKEQDRLVRVGEAVTSAGEHLQKLRPVSQTAAAFVVALLTEPSGFDEQCRRFVAVHVVARLMVTVWQLVDVVDERQATRLVFRFLV